MPPIKSTPQGPSRLQDLEKATSTKSSGFWPTWGGSSRQDKQAAEKLQQAQSLEALEEAQQHVDTLLARIAALEEENEQVGSCLRGARQQARPAHVGSEPGDRRCLALHLGQCRAARQTRCWRMRLHVLLHASRWRAGCGGASSHAALCRSSTGTTTCCSTTSWTSTTALALTWRRRRP